MQKTIAFSDLTKSDMFIDARYKGGSNNNTSDDPINRLMNCGNLGGFRILGTAKDLKSCRLVVLYTSGEDQDWPDYLDLETGSFTYFGDNKKPGHDLHDTPKKGNFLLRSIFEALHTNRREIIPPIFIFSKAGIGRDVVFRGLCVPGFHGYSQTDDLVAVWKLKNSQRFQNYKAIFSILDCPTIEKNWINDIKKGDVLSSPFCPKEFVNWVNTGKAKVLSAGKTREYRTREEQIPSGDGLKILNCIYEFYRTDSYGFEKCAAELTLLLDKNFISYDLTRPWKDGGRDAIGIYKIGSQHNSVKVDYALEAKCYSLNNSVGVRETSRLISRIKYRQFGSLITTSYIHTQAYKEIVDDKHPIMFVSGKDIVDILRNSGIKTKDEVLAWLQHHQG